MIDWADPKRTDVLHFMMVDPNNYDKEYGEIEDVQLGSSPVTYGYYTDTRYASQITFLRGNNYIDKTWIRIIHEVPSEGYVNELGTFIPTSPNVDYNGAETMSLTLQSPFWAYSNNYITAPYTIAKGTSYVKAFQHFCQNNLRSCMLCNPNDYTAGKAVVYEAGTNCLEILFDIANNANNRADIDGHGRITLSPLTNFRSQSPIIELDMDDPRSMIIEGTLKMETEADEVPNRIIVIDGSYVGVANLDDGSEYSRAQRGYIKAEKYSGSGLTSNTQAKQLAESLLNDTKVTHWSMDTMYFPAHCGDTVVFVLEGIKHLCMLQSMDPVNLDTMTMRITLREVG